MKPKNISHIMFTMLVLLMFTLACRIVTGETQQPGSTEIVPAVSEEAQVQGNEVKSTIEAPEPTQLQPTQVVTPQWDNEVENTVEAIEQPQAQPAQEVVHQWGASAVASSEYDHPDWSAAQAIGQPDTQECDDLPTAWASAERTGLDWLEIHYETPVYPDQINVIQTHMPNQVVKVELLDTMNSYHTVYTGQPAIMDCPYTLTVNVQNADYQVVGIKLTIDQTILDPTSWNEIDAVELVGRYVDGEIGNVAAATTAPTADPEPAASQYALPDMSPASISAGAFYYTVTGAGEDATIDNGTFQDQSTTDEYVIGFVSENDRYAVTLFLPHGLNMGPLELKPYEGNSFTKSPSAAIYIGSGYYYADGGWVNIESGGNDSITGSFVFQATYEYDPTRVVTISGVFNEIPLVNK